MQLMSDEAQALTREIREQSAHRICRPSSTTSRTPSSRSTTRGHIETFNPTGERIFGYSQAEILGRTLDFLLPEIEPHGALRVPRALRDEDRRHARRSGRAPDLGRRPRTARASPSKSPSARRASTARDGYIVCIRDITERHLAEQSMRESEARYRTLVEHAPEVDRRVRRRSAAASSTSTTTPAASSRWIAQTLLASGPDRITPLAQSDGSPSFGVARGYIDGALAGEAPVFEWMHCDALGQTHALRGALRAPAELESPPDSREHHRHHRAQARRGDRRRRAPRVREDRRQRAAVIGARGDRRGHRARDAGEPLRDQPVRPGAAGA